MQNLRSFISGKINFFHPLREGSKQYFESRLLCKNISGITVLPQHAEGFFGLLGFISL